jgi:hypothetical protein
MKRGLYYSVNWITSRGEMLARARVVKIARQIVKSGFELQKRRKSGLEKGEILWKIVQKSADLWFMWKILDEMFEFVEKFSCFASQKLLLGVEVEF